MDNTTYHRKFLCHVETIKTYGGLGAVGVIPSFLEAKIRALADEGKIGDPYHPTDAERKVAINLVRDEYLGALMLSESNQKRFSPLCIDLRNQCGYGNDLYPKSINQCLSLLNRWTVAKPANPTRNDSREGNNPTTNVSPTKPPEEALVFAQDTNQPTKSSKDNSSSSKGFSISSKAATVRCKSCGQLGHASSVCPDRKMTPAQIHAMDADDASETSNEASVIILSQQSDNLIKPSGSAKAIKKDFLLVDSQSTINLFSNPNHVANIRKTYHPIRIHCNKGTKFTTKEVDFGNIGVYFDESGIANVLSLFKLGQKYHITYNSRDRGGVFRVTTTKGVLEFKPTSCGLHALNLRDNPDTAFLIVNDADLSYNSHVTPPPCG